MKFANPDILEEDGDRSLEIDLLLEDRRWEPVLDLLPDGLILVDRTGLVRSFNSAAENMTERLRPEAIGRSFEELVKFSQLDLSAAADAYASGEKVRAIVTDGHRKQYLLITRCLRKHSGEKACFLIVLRDADEYARLDPIAAGGSFADVAEIDGEAGSDTDDALVLNPATAKLVERGLRALSMGSRLLILGESGVGKTELARLLHRKSGVPHRPFVHVNCGAIPESLFESEMFGYESGSFTGASAKGKKGLVEAAEGGVLFLDEIGEIPLQAQAKMLQFLEDSAFQRVGATKSRRLQVQVIAATNRDLHAMVLGGTFRRDLFYRLSVIKLALPALRETVSMIDQLTDRFLARLGRRRGQSLRIDASGRARLRAHDFPGNIRELQNLIEQLAVCCDRIATGEDVAALLGPTTDRCATPAPIDDTSVSAECVNLPSSSPISPASLKDAVREFESRVIRDTIRRVGSKRRAAELLGVDIATIVRKSRSSAVNSDSPMQGRSI